MTTAYPLSWPEGWPRAKSSQRKAGSFGTTRYDVNRTKRQLSIAEGMKRVREVLARMGVDVANDVVVSTNLRLNMSGMPRGDQGEPADSGVAVYWQETGKPMRVMAIDTYWRTADNLGAIAATLEAMRAIERHGGAVILDRAFTGFEALPSPKRWWEVLGVAPTAGREEIESVWREKAREAHPDTGGSHARMAELNAARDAGLRQVDG
jgi:hypothetical protein